MKNKVAVEVLDDNYNLFVKASEEVECSNANYYNLLDETYDTQELNATDLYI